MYDEKVQLEILDEIVEKWDDNKPFLVDLSDKIRAANFGELDKNKCFIFPMPDEERHNLAAVDPDNPMEKVVGLSQIGHKFRSELAKKLERERCEQEAHKLHVKRDKREERLFKLAIVSLGVSMVSLFIAGIALLSQFCK